MLAEGPDFPRRRGPRPPLTAILALACPARLGGCRSSSPIGEWGRTDGPAVLGGVGCTRPDGPSVGPRPTGRPRDRAALERPRGAWAAGVLAASSGEPGRAEGIALAGQPLRGSRQQGAPGAPWLAAGGQRLGLRLAQRAVPDETNELGGGRAGLRERVLAGRVVTADARPTQSAVAGPSLAGGGADGRPSQENPPPRRGQSQAVVAPPARFGDTFTVAETPDVGPGRIERRRLTARPPPAGVAAWPGRRPVDRIERPAVRQRTRGRRPEVGYGIRRRPPERADAARLLASTRWPWPSENRPPWLRAGTCDADRSQVRAGGIPPVMAALRNTGLGLLRAADERTIAPARRRFAGQPTAAMALIGIQLEH